MKSTKKFFISLLILIFLFLITACSSNTVEYAQSTKDIASQTTIAESNTVAATAIREIDLTDDQLDEIGDYIEDNLEDTEYAYLSKGVNNYSIQIGFDDQYSDSISKFEYAKKSIEICEQVENDYKLNYMLSIGITLTTSKDFKQGKYVHWVTYDHGNTGTLFYYSSDCDKTTIECSLNQLKDRLKITDFM